MGCMEQPKRVVDPYDYRHWIARRERGVEVLTGCGLIIEFEPRFSDGTPKPDCPLCQDGTNQPIMPWVVMWAAGG